MFSDPHIDSFVKSVFMFLFHISILSDKIHGLGLRAKLILCLIKRQKINIFENIFNVYIITNI